MSKKSKEEYTQRRKVILDDWKNHKLKSVEVINLLKKLENEFKKKTNRKED